MDRRMMLLVIGLVFGTGIGFLIAASYGVTLNGHDHATDHEDATGTGHVEQTGHEDHSAHDHAAMDAVDMPSGATAPTLAAKLHKDPASGWNLHIMTSNFRYAPENASLEHVAGEGHAHIYLNGEKLARVYGDWFHIGAMVEADALLEVELNSNNHQPLSVGGKRLRITVPRP